MDVCIDTPRHYIATSIFDVLIVCLVFFFFFLDLQSTYSASMISVPASSSSVNEFARDWIFPSLTPIQHLLYFVSDHRAVYGITRGPVPDIAGSHNCRINHNQIKFRRHVLDRLVSITVHSIKLRECVELE